MSAARTSYETLLVEVDRGVALVTLNRPAKLNAIDRQMRGDLSDALWAFEADDSVRAVVVTGAGRAFCAGADLEDGFGGRRADAGVDDGAVRPSALDIRPWEMRTPILAAINGAAVGMGLTYPLMWDIRVAAEDAQLGLVFTRRGLLPEGNSLWLLARLIGASRALELLLTGRLFTGEEAAQLGVVGRAVPVGDVVDTTLDLAVDIAANTSPTAVALTKRLFYRQLDGCDRMAARKEELEAFRWLAGRPDVREGVAAFREKRTPDWPALAEELPW
ncbi:MAG TPA: enoyl-CoA hydratase-related protein [Acidimicrobiales bacterium]|nr:enoyl-CoA hydratase-related protein [Acidimicrobiales bacterium]